MGIKTWGKGKEKHVCLVFDGIQQVIHIDSYEKDINLGSMEKGARRDHYLMVKASALSLTCVKKSAEEHTGILVAVNGLALGDLQENEASLSNEEYRYLFLFQLRHDFGMESALRDERGWACTIDEEPVPTDWRERCSKKSARDLTDKAMSAAKEFSNGKV